MDNPRTLLEEGFYSGVAGLDLSLTGAGLAVWIPDLPIATTRISSTGKADATLEQRSDRIIGMASDIVEFIPFGTLVLIEQPSYGSKGGHPHDRSGLWWRVVNKIRQRGDTVVEVAPTRLKKYALGKGSGEGVSKDAMLAHAVRTFPDAEINSNDVADAAWLLAMGCRWLQCPLEPVKLTAPKLQAFDDMVWPEA